MVDLVGMPAVRRVLILLLMTVLAGCAGLGEPRETPAEISDPSGEAVDPGRPDAGRADPVPPEPETVPEPGAPRADTSGGAQNSLLVAALQARSSGDSSRAIALLERAQRIDPDNGRLYLELARTHLDAGNAAQGRATAERGLLYCQREECAALRALID